MHRVFQREEFEVAAVVAKHARKGAPQARVRVRIEWQAIGADHRGRMRQRRLHIRFMHGEVDRAGGLKPVGGFIHRHAPFGGDVAQVAPGHALDGVRPGDQDFLGKVDAVAHQHGRAGDIGIDVEGDVLLFAGCVDFRQGFAHPPEVVASAAFVMRHDHRRAGTPPDLEGLIERIEDQLALVAHVRGVQATESAQRLGNPGHFIGGGCGCGRVIKTTRQTDRALLQAGLQQGAHVFDFVVTCGAFEILAHCRESKGRVADQKCTVDRRLRRLDPGCQRREIRCQQGSVLGDQ